MSGSVSLVNGHVDPDKKPMTFEDVKRIRENPTAEDVDNAELHRLIDIALEKQIPKKYIREKTDFFSFPVIKCPNCTGIIGKVEFLENCELVICPRGCPCCGQAIDNRSEVNDGK